MTPEQEALLQKSLMGQFGAPIMPPAPIGPSSFDVNTMGPSMDSTLKNVGTPPTPTPPISDPAMAPPPPAQTPPIPTGVSAHAPGPVSSNPNVVSSKPGLTGDEIDSYIKGQHDQLNKYGPEQEQKVMDSIKNSQNGLRRTVARGGAAFADGIMQGVARAGNSNFLSSMDRRDQNETENALNLQKSLDESNQKHIAAGQSLDQMDHNSPVGKAMLSTYGPLLDKLGVPKDKQAQMMPALISTMAPELVKHEDVMAKVAAERNRHSEMDAFKQENVDQQNWIKLNHDVNQLQAGSRKALGVAGANNMRADRLLSTSQNKVITPQDLAYMIEDLTGIYKGGVPDEISLKHGQYKTLNSQVGEILTHLTSRPQDVNQPEIVQHLQKITHELKDIDNKVIRDNLGIAHAIYKPLIEKYPERWQEVVDAINGTMTDPGAAPKPAAAGGPAPTQGAKAPYGDTVEKNGKTYRWNSTTGKYHPE